MIATRYAAIFKRFVAFVMDFLFSVLLVKLLMAPFDYIYHPSRLFGGFFHRFWPDRLFDFWSDHLPVFLPDYSADFLTFGSIALYLLYFAVFESSWRQATPGKMLLGIFVTDMQGRRLSFQRALGRSVCRVISFIPCFLGFLFAAFTARKQALHDLLASTLVLEPEYVSPPEVHLPGGPGQAAGPGGCAPGAGPAGHP